ncbi:hypothetical protein F5Y04DRAFT_289386 [Hypomontagnella monticulosa]|nr:hypothetical protein F5Y04DRAFT_289386 [Hypomontagnella monticulosa]
MGSGISTAARVGIAVGAALVTVALGVLVFYTIQRSKRQKQDKPKKNNHYIGMPPAQYPGYRPQRQYTIEIDSPPSSTKSKTSRSFSEMSRVRTPQELPAVEPAAADACIKTCRVGIFFLIF